MSNPLYQIILTMRPRQWLKNLSLFAAITFWGTLFKPYHFLAVSKAFLIFCGLSGGMYLINDVVDAPKDRLHPIKKNRPVASGKLSSKLALFAALFLLLLALPPSYFLINRFFLWLALAFVILQLFYSLYLRNVIILDALAVAMAFIFRVFAGALAIPVPVSSWLILSTIGLALLLAFGKRRSERTILEALNVDLKTRKTLQHYPDALLDSMISMSASFSIITYALFTFQTSPRGVVPSFLELLPATLVAPKWMMLTVPLVIYGVARYLYVIYEKKEAESPEKVLLSDYPLLSVVLLWIFSVVFIIYGLGIR